MVLHGGQWPVSRFCRLTPGKEATDIYYTASWVGVVATKKRTVPAYPALVICMLLHNTVYKMYLLPSSCTSWFERKIVRSENANGSAKENRRIRKNQEMKDILEGADVVKFIKSFSKMVWSCSKNAKPTNSKTNCKSYNGRNKENRKTT